MPPYIRLLVMAILSFIAMYLLMYAMVDKFEDVYSNVNQAYIAALMASPMVIIELLVMGAMYKNRLANFAILAACVVALVLFWFFIRQQTAVADTQFLRSMIPHHSGAILMCREATITEPRIRQLCGRIITSQQEEIDLMRMLLEERDGAPASG